MRLRPQNQRTVYLRSVVDATDSEGNHSPVWTEAQLFKATVQPASGQLNVELYGERLAYMQTLYTQSELIMTGQSEGAGICLAVEKDAKPDYTIISVKTYSTHKVVLIEQRGADNGHRV